MPRTTIRTEDIADSEITSAKILDGTIATGDMAVDPTNASNLSSGSVPSAQLGNVDLTGLEDDIALIGFKVAANGSLAKYDLVDQTVDDFQDASGVDASASTGEARDSSGKYYKGETSTTPTASGGNAVTTDGDYTVHKFTGSGLTFTTDTAQTIEYLVIAGGGGSGSTGGAATVASGGGGAGEFVEGSLLFPAGSYSITRGDGGAAGTSGSSGSQGGDSSIAGTGITTITADGGGAGGASGAAGGSGGSGGGGGSDGGSGSATATGTGRYGFAGGSSGAGATGSAGGGAGAVGESVTTSTEQSGLGGIGRQSDILVAGTDVYYASGGSGGKDPQYSGGAAGGAPGGGGEGANGSDQGQCPGEVNTGGGAGGVGNSNNAGAAGGSGLVVLRRPTQAVSEGADISLVSTATTAESTPTKGDMVCTITNGAGTTTLNTDIKGWVSRDNGTTYTQGTLASQGTTGGHTILTFHDLDISGQPSGTSMRWKITTHNQSATKTTRIQAVSLGWS